MKKHQQLGMNAGTASHRLVKDILFRFVVEAGHTCFRCGGALTRESFSIEHKEAWLDSADPKAMFFDQNNIAFSHLGCNARAKRPNMPRFTPEVAAQRTRDNKRRQWTPEKRREHYLRTGN
jgi:hypothetical protein